MNGYLLNFYKFSPSYSKEMATSATESFNRSIVWSVFDRLEVKKIEEFAEYRKSDVGEKNWLGERQFAMLYELKEKDYKLSFNATSDDCKFVMESQKSNNKKKTRFFGITFIDFTQNFHSFFYDNDREDIGSNIYNTVTTAIDEIIVKNQIPSDEIAFDVYGILGGQDLAIIWLTSQFEYIAQILEALRNSSSQNGTRAIANVSSIIGINDINNSELDFEDVKGRLVVKLTKRETYDDEQFKKNIDEIIKCTIPEPKLHTLFGEHDLLFEIPANKFIPQLYKRDGLFNPKSPKFSRNFIQSKTEIIIKGNYEEEWDYKFPFQVDSIKTEGCLYWTTASKDLYRKIEEIEKSDCFKDAPYLQETLWLLYEDFLKNITSTFSYPWSCDLYYQFEESMNYLIVLVKSDITRYEIYDNIHNIISSMRQMMLHVAQANRLFFEVPNTHLKHTGSYSKILHMYYGVVKKYLELAYDISKYDLQSSVIPFISFDVTPIAKSQYCDRLDGYQNSIIRIELPYDALVNIPKYIKLLAHEIYHYVAPRNREERNLLVASISFSLLMGQIAGRYMDLYLYENWDEQQRENWIIIFQNLVRAQALNYIIDNTNKLKTMVNDCQGVWDEFFDQFDKSFESNFFADESYADLLYQWIHCAIDKMNRESGYETIHLDERKDFNNCLVTEKYNLIKYPLDRDIRYALREASADYFMIQVTEMSFEEYIQYLFDYKEIMESDDDDVAQRTRCALGIDLFLRQEINEKTGCTPEGKERNDIILEILKSHLSLSEDKIHKLAEDYIEIKTAFKLYQKAFELYFKPLNFEEIREDCPRFKEQLEKIKELLALTSDNNFFNNVKYVEKFQKQETLRMLESEKNTYGRITMRRPDVNLGTIKVDIGDVEYNKKVPFSNKVTNLSELLEAISREILSISDDEETEIWFRGHEDIRYLLIPSLYRMKDKQKFFYASPETRRDTLESLLDLFKVKAYNAPELVDKTLNDDVRVIAAMQHYAVPTNLLDWSTSVFAAIYFALMSEINDRKSKGNSDAVIYILNPTRMNVVRNRIYKSNILNIKKYKQIQYPIPAISANKSLFEGYLPTSKENPDDSIFPIAGYVPYDNSRIKAQLGTFTIFGLDNIKDCYGEDIQEDTDNKQVDFSKCSLWDMQEKYEDMCKTIKDLTFQRFLARVVIDGDSKLDIAKSLQHLGMTKSGYFPELENLSQELTSQVAQYLNIVNK